MHAVAGLLPLVGIVSTLLPEVSATTHKGCRDLSKQFSDAVFYPKSSVYDYESQNFWSNTEILSPACVFRPRCSEQLAQGIGSLAEAHEQFAVRGGGHMGIKV